MNQTSIILIIILLLGIFLFAILGEKIKESMQGTFTGTFNATKDTDSSNSSTSNKISGASTSSGVNYDNYNHFTQSSTQLSNGSTFYGENGGNVVINTSSDGTQTLTVTLADGQTPMVFTNVQPAVNNETNTTVENYTNYTTSSGGTANTFYGPMGDQATVVKTSDGQQAINVQTSEGAYTFTSSGSLSNPNNTTSSTQYYGSTGTPIQTSTNSLAYNGPYGTTAAAVTGPEGNTAYYAQGPAGNTVAGTTSNTDVSYNQYYGPNGGSAGYVTGPQGNSAYYAQGPYGNTAVGTSTNTNSNQYYGPNGGTAGSVTGPQGNTAYYAQGQYGNTAVATTGSSYPNNYDYSNSLPPGIPKSMIPSGEEDLYILKSQIIPPVCPPPIVIHDKSESCAPCPSPSRCKYPPVTCKAVPDYNNINDQFLPQPILNDFSQFGM